jgi:chromosome segregation ATPase
MDRKRDDDGDELREVGERARELERDAAAWGDDRRSALADRDEDRPDGASASAGAARARDGADDVLGDRTPVQRGDRIRDRDDARTADRQERLAADAAAAAETLRMNAESVRQVGANLEQVHSSLRSNAERVQALRDATRSLGNDIARTREAVQESSVPGADPDAPQDAGRDTDPGAGQR